MKKKTILTVFALFATVTFALAQFVDSTTYDFRDGTIITAGQSADGALKLSGNYSHHGTQYGLNMKVDGQIKVAIDSNSTVRFLGSKYSKLNMVATTSANDTLGTHFTQVTNDGVDTYDFVYAGPEDTLTFTTTAGTGGDLYLPLIEVIPAQLGSYDTLTTPVKNIIYTFDFRDGSIIPTTTPGNVDVSKGLVDVKVGTSNAYSYNGAQHGVEFKTGNQIVLQVAGNSYIKVGGCQYSNGTISASSSTGAFDVDSQSAATSACWDADSSSVDFLYVGTAGEVTLDFTTKVYVPIIEIVPLPFDVSLSAYAQKSGEVIINNDTITLITGANAADAATITLAKGILLSSSTSDASVAMNLGGSDLSSITPVLTGDIASSSVVDGKLVVAFSDQSTDIKEFTFEIYDNSYLHDVTTYDFTDGSIITDGQSTDGSLKLSGSYSLHGTTYGLDMGENATIKIAVTSNSTIRFLGSEYSGYSMECTTSSDSVIGTQNAKVENDLSDTYDFVYAGPADTLTFTAVASSKASLYVPYVEVIPEQKGAVYNTIEENIVYYYDFRDGSIVPTTPTAVNISKGLVDVIVGSSNAYGYNGTQHGSIFKEGNQIVLEVAGNSYIKVGGCQYSNGTISVSSSTGDFKLDSQASQTSECYHNDSSTVDFLYVGTTGTVTLDFTGTNYVPIIQVVPVTEEVSLVDYVVKSGSIELSNGTISTIINYTSGASASENPTVTVSEGTVVSATAEVAAIRINLGGEALSAFTPTCTDSIASATISNDTIFVTLKNTNTLPQSYIIKVTDNSTIVEAEPGTTYTYNFADGSVLPQTSYSSLRYTTYVTEDGILTLNSNTETTDQQFGFHDGSHGAVLFPGNSMDIIVAGNAIVTFNTCQYGSAADGIFEFTDSEGNVLGTTASHNIGTGTCGTNSYSYLGAAGTITATLVSVEHSAAEVYIHGVTIENSALIIASGKIDVWDFGAEQLDTADYKNNLNVETINGWYAESITPGSSGNVLPSFSAGVLSWIGGGNDRLRSTNTDLTRYDENVGTSEYTGRIYVNSSSNTGRYLSLSLSADDEITIWTKTDAGGNINFEYVNNPSAQTDKVAITSDLTELTFVAKEAGTYHIFDDQGKPSYFRIYRKDADYGTVSGVIDLSQAEGIPSDYAIQFENEAGKVWTSNMSGNAYSAVLPLGKTYKISLYNANGYIISSGNSIEVTEENTTLDISIQKVNLFTVSGSVSGLDAFIANLELVYIPDPELNKIFIPDPVLTQVSATYSVMLEPDCKYTIEATGVNDFALSNNELTIPSKDTTVNLGFVPKPLHNVAITATGISTEQLTKLGLTFSNLNEEGYVYSFNSIDNIKLRNGTYTIDYSGIDEYPLELALTSNLTVNDADATKELTFQPIRFWTFADRDISSGETAYNGLLFTGGISSQSAKGHLVASTDATVKVPVNVGDKVKITYYYTADFTIEGTDTYSTNSQSTGTMEYADYVYTGTENGYVTITFGSGVSTSYIQEIQVTEIVDYAEIIYVGADKDYTTINDALAAIGKMVRDNTQRVTVMIDPGNYEEMLVINVENVTFKNASTTPNIKLLNEGVDIDENAVRITSYYGHGYNYYSMTNNQKWNADVLRVNKANGYLSYENKGAGTTNGSYWNSTVVITANGFVADDIIFENSFNQYISQKESEDIIELWESGNKGVRPTAMGSTDVQNKSFVERAAAIAITNGTDKVVLNKCRIIGRQDSFYGGVNTRVVAYKGAMMGATDYIFGGMTAVFYKSDLVMNTSEDKNDVCYITAAQQSEGRGYLMYECNITSPTPEIETASTSGSKPGYFGRPWQANTSEVVFFNTNIDECTFTGYDGESLILPLGWNNTLGGESAMMYEFGTVEEAGVDNSASRASWATLLNSPVLTDGTDITTLNFTKGNDGWDPLPALIAADTSGSGIGVIEKIAGLSAVDVYAYQNQIYVRNVTSQTQVKVFNVNGSLAKSLNTNGDLDFALEHGLYIIQVLDNDGQKVVKVVTQ